MMDLNFTQEEKEILRAYANRVAEIAALPIQQKKVKLWTAHNDLQTTEPVVYIDMENGWGECITEADLQCHNEIARYWEMILRKEIYWFEILKDDHVIDNNFDVGYSFHDTGWGVELQRFGGDNGGSYKVKQMIEDYEEDFDKIRYPKIIIDWEESDRLLALAHETFDGILNVRRASGWWWSLGMTANYIDLRGLEDFLCDFILEPEWVHRLMNLLCVGQLERLDFLEKNNLLSLNTGNSYVGSGGFGFTNQLPAQKEHVTTMDMWGFVESQETNTVSPDTYGEFIFPYHKRIAERFGLNCYGCCEPVDGRWNYAKQLPRLRRVSYSPWAKWETAPEYLGKNYITSLKPMPTPLSMPHMNEEEVRRDIRRALDVTQGCVLEIIMKDTHTLGHNPRNASRWVEIVREEINR